MEPNLLCSEDRSNPAVCCCFCRFPLPTLCAECLSKHQADPDLFQHFHLPVYASQCITSKEIRAQYSTWFLTLHNAHSMLKENEEELTRFEEQIETARLEAVHQIDLTANEARQRLASLKEAFSREMQRAISETSMHAMEQWSPEKDSLSSLVWNYSLNDPASLRLFRLWAGIGSGKPAVHISIETSLPSLAAFNQPFEDCEQAEQLRIALEDATRKNEVMSAENEALMQKLKILDEGNVRLAQELEELNKSSSETIQSLTEEVDALRLSQKESQHSHCNESDLRNEAAALLDKGIAEKAAFHYSESAQWLQQSWDLLSGFADKQAAAAGAVLGEVLGLHLGRTSEAREVVKKCNEIEVMRDPYSEEVMKLSNLLAAICFFQGKFAETETICSCTLQTFAQTNHSSEHFWVAIFYLTYSLCDLRKDTQADNLLSEWMSKPTPNETRLTQLLKLSARGIFQVEKCNYQEAEGLLLEAHILVTSELPTSMTYAALILFWLGRAQEKTKQVAVAKEKYIAAELILTRHFPSCIWTTFCLVWLSDLCKDANQPDEALRKRLEAHHIYEAHFPTDINTAINLACLANLYRDMGQRKEALEKRLAAHRIFEVHFPTHILTAINLNSIGLLYEQMGRLEEAEPTYEEARSRYSAHHPTSNNAAINLYNLADLYEKRQNTESAIALATSAFEIWSKNNSDMAQSHALPLLSQLKGNKDTP